ncbi:PcfJ domain-containing protein [Methylomonas sp. MgM2]
MTELHDTNKPSAFSSDESHWNNETQELTIDLTRLLNLPNRLVLTGWHSASCVTWRNEFDSTSDGGDHIIEYHTDPFDSSLFPIEMFDNSLLQPWTEQIPPDLVNLLKLYKGNAFGMLMLCNRYQHIVELFQRNSTLFWLFFTYAQDHRWDEERFVNTCLLPRTEILRACDLPARKAVVKLLSKLRCKRFARSEYELIIQLLHLDFEKLNHRQFITGDMARFLVFYSALIDSKLILHINDADCMPITMLVNDIVRMCGFGHTEIDTTLEQVKRCSNIKQVHAIHDHLVNELNQQIRTSSFAAQREHKPFPVPPLPGNNNIVPITDLMTLHEESLQQRHCVASYDYEIEDGHYYVYRVLAPGRATLGIKITHTHSGASQLRIDQLKGERNSPVNDATYQAVLLWFNAMQSHQFFSESSQTHQVMASLNTAHNGK